MELVELAPDCLTLRTASVVVAVARFGVVVYGSLLAHNDVTVTTMRSMVRSRRGRCVAVQVTPFATGA